MARWWLGVCGSSAAAIGTFYMDADPTNTYLDTINTGNPQGVIWDETTQVGTLTAVNYDDGVSLTFIQVLEDITVQPDGAEFFGYADVIFSPTAPLGTVSLDLIFYDDTATEITRFTGTNTGSTSVVGLHIDTTVTVPAGGSIRLEVTFSGAGTFTYGGDIELGFTIP